MNEAEKTGPVIYFNALPIVSAEANSLPSPTLNRQSRRWASKHYKESYPKVQDTTQLNAPVTQIELMDEVLEHETDEGYLKAQLRDYLGAASSLRSAKILTSSLTKLGIPNSIIQQVMFDPALSGVDQIGLVFANLPRLNLQGVAETRRITTQLLKQKAFKYTDGEEQVLLRLYREHGLTFVDFLDEAIRTRQENIDLLKMQLEWLKTRPPVGALADETISATSELTPTQPVEVDTVPDPALVEATAARVIEERFPLSDWRLWWTNHDWSTSPNHLVPLVTSSRDVFVEMVEKLSRRQRTIKPESFANAVEFFLTAKNALQKALSAHNKYVEDELKDWVKTKRGKDRIGIYVIKNTDEEKEAIVFIDGRDQVYRGL